MTQSLTSTAVERTELQTTTLRLLASCLDSPGIVAALTSDLADVGANIRELSQFITDANNGTFFLRLMVDVPGSSVHRAESAIQRASVNFGMEYSLWPTSRRKRMAILCSTGDHCVLDLLWRAQNGDLAVDVPVVISNHELLREPVQRFDVPFVHVPATAANRTQAEARLLDVVRTHHVDFVVLARYMQILTDDFLHHVGCPVINIHHSLLPAFIGAQPYQRAFERGVKIIGATAHYATPELDAGPIIEQDVEHVGHTDDAAAMQRRGKNLERTVLARAVALHVEDRVHVHHNRTILHV
jgi:formyltetrahydrofolate deformylase